MTQRQRDGFRLRAHAETVHDDGYIVLFEFDVRSYPHTRRLRTFSTKADQAVSRVRTVCVPAADPRRFSVMMNASTVATAL